MKKQKAIGIPEANTREYWLAKGPYGLTPVWAKGKIVKYTNSNGNYDLNLKKIRN